MCSTCICCRCRSWTMHVESVGASSCRVQVDMPKNTRIYFRYFSEDALTDEISSLKTTAARLKFKGIDGGLHKRWSMWFNSKQRAEPYQSLQYTGNNCYKLSFGIQALHGCRQFVAWAVGLSPRTNATLLTCITQRCVILLDCQWHTGGRWGWRQVRMALMGWATHVLQWRTQRDARWQHGANPQLSS